jgi:hypothetical protein
LADVAFFTARDENTEVVGQPRLGLAPVADFSFVRAADAHLILIGIFVSSSV